MAKYNGETVERICALIRADSYPVAEICELAGIAKDTYYSWLKKKPDFSYSIKKAENEYNEFIVREAKRSLVRMIQGYSVRETKRVTCGNKVENTVTDRHILPVPAAVIFALTNRDPENWKNRQDAKVSADVGIRSSLECLSDGELQKIIDGGS
jgi:hypothetical protein